ncbi:KIF-binding protein-like [Palaemon carinicauda]|uniref:KIF-binding protein-like n=1 Tax=Palaemon carinicauda TaxID=392227 RepID=UPI0035B67893
MATLEDQYQKALRLYQEESQNDPFSEPYKSKYAARDILEELKARLSKQLDEDDDEDDDGSGEEGTDVVGITRARLAAVVYHLGVIAVETEELSTGEEHLNKVLTIVGDAIEGISGASSANVNEADLVSAALMGDAESLLSSSSGVPSVSPIAVSPLTVALAISCHNQLGILWSNRTQFPRAKQHLERACLLYTEYQQRNSSPPRTIGSLFSSISQVDEGWEENGMNALEKLHTHTLYYLAQVYGHMGMDEKSAGYCHSTLKRQLSCKDCDLIDWAVNAANLSQFYLRREKFRIARHLLSSALKVLSQYEFEVRRDVQDEDCEEATTMHEKFDKSNADVQRCWGRYCLVLLQFSVDRAIPDDESSTNVREPEELEEDTLDKELEFLQLDVCDLESEVVAKPVKNFDEARQVFLSGLRWLSSARQYYNMEDHAGDHVNITQEMSLLYKALAFFEPSEERKSKMHKRRIDLLSAVIGELNPRYYMNVCRQINYELAETYSTMMDSKYSIIGQGNEPTSAQAKKINTLATSSIQHFLHYLDSMKDTDTGEQPEKYSEDSVRPALVAWFHLGRLWSKLISTNQQSKIQNIAQSLQNYKRVVEYCDKNKECEPIMAQELAICREMVQLLPLKMEQMRNQCR